MPLHSHLFACSLPLSSLSLLLWGISGECTNIILNYKINFLLRYHKFTWKASDPRCPPCTISRCFWKLYFQKTGLYFALALIGQSLHSSGWLVHGEFLENFEAVAMIKSWCLWQSDAACSALPAFFFWIHTWHKLISQNPQGIPTETFVNVSILTHQITSC